jgi:two-component system sensor histidine kinase QseC
MSARPTLVRRVVLALLLAFGLIFALNLAAIFWQVTSQGRADARLRARAETLLALAERAATTAEARAAAAAAAGILNQPGGSEPGNPRAQRQDVVVVLADAAGAQVYGSAGAADIGNGAFRTYRAASPRWSVTVAEAKFSPGWLLLKIGGEMGIYLFVSFLLVLGAIWLAVSRGLRPLQRLSDRIAARGPDDLQPLGVNPEYAELVPVTTAIDRMLAQLRGKMETERGFVQDAAHELRTPLAVISAQAHVLARTAGGEQRAAAERDMDRAIERASRLIRQLLELARVDSAPPGESATIDIAQLVRQEMALLAPAAMARDVELSLESPDTLFHALEVPPLQSILQNLLGNAIQYVGAGGQVMVELRAHADGLRLSVADDGPGIAADEQAEIFERFRRGSGQESPGSGLGRAIVKQFAARLNGTVRLAPGLGGKGCTFMINLPDHHCRSREGGSLCSRCVADEDIQHWFPPARERRFLG